MLRAGPAVPAARGGQSSVSDQMTYRFFFGCRLNGQLPQTTAHVWFTSYAVPLMPARVVVTTIFMPLANSQQLRETLLVGTFMKLSQYVGLVQHA